MSQVFELPGFESLLMTGIAAAAVVVPCVVGAVVAVSILVVRPIF